MPVTAEEPLALSTELIVDVSQRFANAPDRAAWNRLAGDMPFRRFEWQQSWWRHYGQALQELFLVTVRDATQQELVGIAPFAIQAHPIQGRVVRFLGQGTVCSEYLSLLSADGREQEVADQVARHLNDTDRAIDCLQLDGIRHSDASVEPLVQTLCHQYGWSQRRTPGDPCWRIPLPVTWDDYLANLSKRRRWRVRKMFRELITSGKATVHVAGDDQIETGLAVLEHLHQSRRNSLGQRGCFADVRFQRFLHDAVIGLSASGDAELQRVELEGEPISAQIDLIGQGTAFHYQSGLEVARQAQRPGWLGMASAIKRSIEAGRQCFDLLRGDESYKSHWRAQPVAMSRYHLFAPHARGRAARSWYDLRSKASMLRRQLRGLVG